MFDKKFEKMFTEVVSETEEYKKAAKKIDDVVSGALRKHLETHAMFFAYPHQDPEHIFQELIANGIYNGKTVTFKTPMGTITYHAEVNAPNA